jgi:hypothetical protein
MDRRSGKDRRYHDSTLLAPDHQKRTCFRNKSYGHSRQHHRFNALKDSYVVLRSPPDERLGFLSDISTGGLSFEYIPIEESLNKTDEIGIIFSDNNTCIEKLSCKKIYEIELEDEYYTPVKMHRVGIEFEDIETEPLNKLLIIIRDLAKFNLKEGNT